MSALQSKKVLEIFDWLIILSFTDLCELKLFLLQLVLLLLELMNSFSTQIHILHEILDLVFLLFKYEICLCFLCGKVFMHINGQIHSIFCIYNAQMGRWLIYIFFGVGVVIHLIHARLLQVCLNSQILVRSRRAWWVLITKLLLIWWLFHEVLRWRNICFNCCLLLYELMLRLVK